MDKFEAAAIRRRPVSELERSAIADLQSAAYYADLPQTADTVREVLAIGRTMRAVDFAAHTLAREFLKQHEEPRQPKRKPKLARLKSGDMYWSKKDQCYKMKR